LVEDVKADIIELFQSLSSGLNVPDGFRFKT